MAPRDVSALRTGLLLSGGLDSAILLGHLLRAGHEVQPFYIRSGLMWERLELGYARRFLHALTSPRLAPLVVLRLPLADVYGRHWATTGEAVPDACSPDDAVYLPGRNALLTIKAALWCQMHGIERLALAVLGSNPFPDATPGFFNRFAAALSLAGGKPVRFWRPFGRWSKCQVMRQGRGLPLELTFSCIAPVDGLHCGRCNKCAERHKAFQVSGDRDPTRYAHRLPKTLNEH
jgi:7-cyano-7-deazaguanine synthase